MFKPSQNRAPVLEWWRFQEKALKVSIILQFIFEHVFYGKIKFFQHGLTRVTNRKLCFLQLKLSMFTFYPKIASRKKTPKNTSKMVKKQVLKPEKWASCRGETLGCGKTFFFNKKTKHVFWPVLRWILPPPNPVFYKEFAWFLHAKKCTFGVHLGSIWGPHVPKTLLFTMNIDDFRKVVFEYKNEQRKEKDWSRWPQVEQFRSR